MRVYRPSVAIIAGLVTAALWLLSGIVRMLAGSNVYATRVLSVAGITPLSSSWWGWPGLWAPLALVGACLLLGSVVVLVMRLAKNQSVIVVWFAAVVAGAVLGLSNDALSVLSSIGDFGWRALAMADVESGTKGAFWGLAQGWIPALIARRLGRTRESPADVSLRAAVIVAAAALLAFLIVGVFGTAAWRDAIVVQNAEAAGLSEDDGAYPDPSAPGSPPPLLAPGSTQLAFEEGACTPDNSTLLLGNQDAGLGRRSQTVFLTNFSDAACTVEGYFDIALADQNGNELSVNVSPGSPYMATDAGAHQLEIPAQGQATATLAWDANSTHGALVARTLYAAMLPGMERGSWPVELDIIEGTAIEITAWEISAPAGAN